MIQRVQSLYLSLLFLLSLLFFNGAVLGFSSGSGKVLKLMYSGKIYDQTGQIFGQIINIWPLSVIFILLPLVAVITILMYKNRKIQLYLSLFVIALSSAQIVALSCCICFITTTYKITVTPGLKMAASAIILLFSVLAYRGILKDDRIVKSYDRLR